jgi:hypothetical protein
MPSPVYPSPSLGSLVTAMLESIKIVRYRKCSLRVSHHGILLVLKAHLPVVAEVVLSHGTRRRRRDESKHTLFWVFLLFLLIIANVLELHLIFRTCMHLLFPVQYSKGLHLPSMCFHTYLIILLMWMFSPKNWSQ